MQDLTSTPTTRPMVGQMMTTGKFLFEDLTDNCVKSYTYLILSWIFIQSYWVIACHLLHKSSSYILWWRWILKACCLFLIIIIMVVMVMMSTLISQRYVNLWPVTSIWASCYHAMVDLVHLCHCYSSYSLHTSGKKLGWGQESVQAKWVSVQSKACFHGPLFGHCHA